MARRSRAIFPVALAAVLVVAGTAGAAPPGNDNRAAAQTIPAFPADVAGTTVEATVERLDPQVSECGRVESTVWYRIAQAPDGTVALAVQGPGLAPVLRVYDLEGNAISERSCDAVGAGARATVSFETERGAGYLVLVGKRPGTADAAYTLTARLFLPPANDSLRQATRLRRLPATIAGTTFGATSDDADPGSCELGGGTVWYALPRPRSDRLAVRLRARGELDASVAVVQRVRSRTSVAKCAATDRNGEAELLFAVERGASYTVVVGEQEGSPPGAFELDLLASRPPERAPGRPLPGGRASSTLNGLTDVNDVWSVALRPGRTYRIALTSTGCPVLGLTGQAGVVRTLACAGYTTFTPGPDGGGRYLLELQTPLTTRTISYRVRVVPALPDDVGVGVELANLATARGRLDPLGVDLVDLYHFDVAERSDVRLRLATPARYTVLLLTDQGRRVAASADEIRRRLERGRYVVAVGSAVGWKASRYALSLVVRTLTATTLSADAAEVTPGTAVSFTAGTAPPADGGWIELEIDRFDPLTGWQFSRLLRVRAPAATVRWTPPDRGRWRARASYLGTLRFSPSTSPYVHVLVAKPLSPG
jgi:hypothetical protein